MIIFIIHSIKIICSQYFICQIINSSYKCTCCSSRKIVKCTIPICMYNFISFIIKHMICRNFKIFSWIINISCRINLSLLYKIFGTISCDCCTFTDIMYIPICMYFFSFHIVYCLICRYITFCIFIFYISFSIYLFRLHKICCLICCDSYFIILVAYISFTYSNFIYIVVCYLIWFKFPLLFSFFVNYISCTYYIFKFCSCFYFIWFHFSLINII